ncbi:hypothetical protein DPMN_166581 [Dreissena polymorpha]|uniref:Uncharacterized protein n=1 Tax=Dreissena polymorpha TaxID=45954 RepID=A0A9D4IXQ8_DREPO|nr:hypothetical protein DPMN_166581 [Dreissena polymorpha]
MQDIFFRNVHNLRPQQCCVCRTSGRHVTGGTERRRSPQECPTLPRGGEASTEGIVEQRTQRDLCARKAHQI